MEQMKKVLEALKNPSEEFTPIPFWFFNDVPEREKIKKQLSDYTAKGVNGIVLHPRIGLPESLPYLSKEYFEIVRFITETAANLEMKIILYDEGMYPSGSAHGMVVEENPEYASKGIILTASPESLTGEAEILATLSGGNYLVYAFTGGTIRGIHFGEDDKESGAPKSADILNPAAVESFIRLTHERYYQNLKEFFGTTIIGFFTDEPCALGRNAGGFREWVPGMEQELLKVGCSMEDLAGLFEGKENAATKQYHKLIKKHLRETFYARLSEWCEMHGILLMGHPEASDDVEEELYFHVPGQDLIMRRVSPESGGLLEADSVQAKLPADIARHSGRIRNANECFGVCCRNWISWYFTGRDMKWYIDWLAMRGVNLFIPHAFYYSIEGKRKDERPPDVGPNNIWWEHYRMFSDYMKRLSYLMTSSVNGAKIAVLCDNNRVPHKEVACLYENQIEFNYLPIAMLAKCSIAAGKLCIGDYAYETVLDLLGEEDCSKQQLAGVRTVYDAGELLKQDSLRTVKVRGEILSGQNTGKTEICCKNLRAVSLKKDGVKMYLLSNEGEENVKASLFFPEKSLPIEADLWNGTFYSSRSTCRGNETELSLLLEPCETRLFLIPDEPAGIKAEQVPEEAGDWTEYFILVEKGGNKASYYFCYQTAEVSGMESFTVHGEEMIECFVNGRFAGVSFWNTHRFHVGPYLQTGENEIWLKVTGNAANLYGKADIWYGLGNIKPPF